MLSLENIESRFEKIVSSEEWKLLQEKYNSSEHILMFGHGGNMAVADHAAIDGSRLTDKNIIAPGSGILSTSIIADTNFNDWIMNWVKIRTRGLDSNKCMAIGFSCSLNNPSSNAIVTALNWCDSNNISTGLISAQYKPCGNSDIIKIVQDVELYHNAEILSLALTYELIHSAGFECPSLVKTSKK
jgi:D-sedoheptulose 7-phosphate isomerase